MHGHSHQSRISLKITEAGEKDDHAFTQRAFVLVSFRFAKTLRLIQTQDISEIMLSN